MSKENKTLNESENSALNIADVSNCKRLNSKDKRFNAMWDWEGFAIGFQVSKPHKCTGWNWYVSLDFTFLSLWWYF